jgi:hypothetical protein
MLWQYFTPKFEYEKTFEDHLWPWAGHKTFAYDLIRNLKPKIMVELGTHYGTSFFSMAQAAKDAQLKTELHAIDSWEGDPQAGFYDETVLETVTKLAKKYYPDQRIHLHKKYFDAALPDFKQESIDILHIDGLHTYEAVKHDFETWLGRVAKDGIILFHDTNERNGDFGVYKLWEELEKKYDTIQFLHSHGLGILFKGGYPSKEWKQNEKLFQEHYSALHAKIYFPKENEELKKSILELREYIGKLESGINDNAILREELERYVKDIRVMEHQINLISSTKFFKLWQAYAKIIHGK